MASSGSGNRSKSGNRSGSGNRKPTTAAGGGNGGASAADRARQRATQPQTSGRGQGGGRGTGRPSGGPSRRPPQRNQGLSSGARWGIGGGIVVIVAVVAIILASMGGGGTASNAPKPMPVHADASVTNAITHVSPSLLAQAGDGKAQFGAVPTTAPSSTGMLKLTGQPLTSNGKPLVVYLGSEYCPYCGATRWPLIIALSRFGTFSNLKLTASSPYDVYHDTPTFTFHGSTYSSPYLVFDPTEELSNVCKPGQIVNNTNYAATPAQYFPSKYACNEYYKLDTPSKSVNDLFTQQDSAANFGPSNAGGIPFINFGGKYIQDGAIYSPGVLHGLTHQQVINTFQAPKEGTGQQILAAANRYTAMICQMTGGKPGSVCNTSVVKAAEKALG